MICILDYGSGNVRSVFTLLNSLKVSVVVSNKKEDILTASHLILPGVGAFGAAMEKIRHLIPLAVLEEAVRVKRTPFLGICVGMQVLADKGYEFGEHHGLGWIPGVVRKMEVGEFPLPHIGWNNIEKEREHPLLHGLGEREDFYFVHSFAFSGVPAKSVIARTDYGGKFISVVAQDNIFGVQFHPEKSQRAGARLLKNFLALV